MFLFCIFAEGLKPERGGALSKESGGHVCSDTDEQSMIANFVDIAKKKNLDVTAWTTVVAKAVQYLRKNFKLPIAI